MVRQQERNRGVVLLVVVSLLVLFVLIAVTFAIVAGQYKHAAQATAKFQIVGDSSQKELDKVVYTLLRDTNDRSVLQGHSLLNDKYGKDATGGVVVTANGTAGGQFMLLSVNLINPSTQPGFYNGNVFTFTTGAAKGHSTRVVGYSPPSTLQIESVDVDGTAIPLPSAGDGFGINGRAFNGTGFGYQGAGAGSPPGAPGIVLRTDPASTNTLDLVATQPVFAHYATTPTVAPDAFGADESWDAPDNNNLILAMVPPSAATSSEIMPSFHRQDLIAYWFRWLGQASNPLSSLSNLLERQIVFAMPYGPDNIRNNADEGAAPWSNVSLTNRDAIVALKRKIIFRPLPEDHPQFTGSNPGTTPIFGLASSGQTFNILTGTGTGAAFGTPDIDNNSALDLWDVDNDGDGVPDSIWLDPGLPVVTSPDGRQYKRLVAILCRDMDGRINLNAASALAHLNANYSGAISGNLAGTPGPNLYLPRGIGFGVADLNLRHLFPNNAIGNNEYSTLLQARYGADLQPGAAATDDLLSAAKSLGIPNNYTTGPAAFGSPPDLSGQGAVALDYNGQPLTGYMGNNGETTDDPYESDPLHNRPQDAMYTVADLERLLRSADPDAQLLSPRLLNVAPNVLGNRTNQRRVTTHSVHVPVPNVTLPSELRSDGNFAFAAGRPATVLDLYRGRLIAGGVLSNNIDDDRNGVTDDAGEVDAEMRKLVPFEILHGQPFDLNRWFGNGIDDNGNGVIDEFQEELAGETVWPTSSVNQFSSTVGFSYTNDSSSPPSVFGVADPRQLYARHLFCMAVALKDSNYSLPFTREPGLNPTQQNEYTIRQIAQWAINCVEFRDRDAIMTPFEYDANPWNGWHVDGDPRTNEMFFATDGVDNDGDGMTDEADEVNNPDRRLVWGAEYPDLVLTETVAFHNRGVKDTQYEINASMMPEMVFDSMGNRVDDLDQFRIPQGSAFLEFLCTRNRATSNAAFPMELYSATGALDLGRLAPARTFGMSGPVRHPVWRAMIARVNGPGGNDSVGWYGGNRPVTQDFDPQYPSNTPRGYPEVRIVWFAPYAPPAGTPEASRVFYGRTGTIGAAAPANPAPSNVLIAPSQYLMVGPRPDTRLGSLIGGADANPATWEPAPEALLIAGGTFSVTGDLATSYPIAAPAMGAQIQSPAGIVCAANPPANWTNQGRQIGLNISEPLPASGAYYPEPNPTNDGRVPPDSYADMSLPFDPAGNYLPDQPLDVNNAVLQGNLETGVRTAHRSVFLQRLANPLLPWNPDPLDPEFGRAGLVMVCFNASLPVNPYITVDWSDIDLTVFSGDENTNSQNNGNWIDLTDQDPYNNSHPENLSTRERGSRQPPTYNVDTRFWNPVTTRRDQVGLRGGGSDYYFRGRMANHHTFGYLNWTMGDAPTAPAVGYEGAPPTPFPWLTWNNRPFANPLELMLVPVSSPARLLNDFSLLPTGAGVSPYTNVESYHLHLMNFFHTANTPGASSQLQRLFDYVETPSHFVGAEKWYYAPNFVYNPMAQPDYMDTFRPPYNRLSRFREPGRPNINTMFDVAEWQAVAAGFQKDTAGGGGPISYQNTGHADFFNNHLSVSRRGYPTANYGDYPTIFANPFRTSSSGDLMPDISATVAGVGNVSMRKQYNVEATLLRPDPLTPTELLFDFSSGDAYDQTTRNPYFHLRGLNRLSNLVSTHSNVYAIWLTVGYFVVEPGPIDAGHPDGYRLGAELGSDRGAIRRHRAFYLIDRSIPVAFEPGQDHNVDRTILLRRFIE